MRWRAAGFRAISVVAFLILAGTQAIVPFGPLLFPSTRLVGLNEIRYARVVILAIGIGLFVLPFGASCYPAFAIGRASPDTAMRRIWSCLLPVLLVAAAPWFRIGVL